MAELGVRYLDLSFAVFLLGLLSLETSGITVLELSAPFLVQQLIVLIMVYYLWIFALILAMFGLSLNLVAISIGWQFLIVSKGQMISALIYLVVRCPKSVPEADFLLKGAFVFSVSWNGFLRVLMELAFLTTRLKISLEKYRFCFLLGLLILFFQLTFSKQSRQQTFGLRVIAFDYFIYCKRMYSIYFIIIFMQVQQPYQQPYYPQQYPQQQYPAQYMAQPQPYQQGYAVPVQQYPTAQNQYNQYQQNPVAQPQPYYQQPVAYQQPYGQYQQPPAPQPNVYEDQPLNDNRAVRYEQRSNQSLEVESQRSPNNARIRNNDNNSRAKFTWTCKTDGRPLDPNERLPFVRKVYGILLVQLAFTVMMGAISYTSPGFRKFQIRAWYLLILAVIGMIGTEVIIFCYPKYAWKVPRNYILLFIFTLCMSWIVSFACSRTYENYGQAGGSAIVMAATLCFALTLGISIYAWRTKHDFTTMGAALWMFSIGLLFFGFLLIFFYTRALMLFYCLLCVILYGLYLIYDTQLILGGKTHEFSIDDYIVAALVIYTDIIQLFLMLLDIVAGLIDC